MHNGTNEFAPGPNQKKTRKNNDEAVSQISNAHEEKSKPSIELDLDEDVLPVPMSSLSIPSIDDASIEIHKSEKTSSNEEKDQPVHLDFKNSSPLQIRSVVHEEIFEFNLSDPITEPVAVEGCIEESYEENSIITSSISAADNPDEKVHHSPKAVVASEDSADESIVIDMSSPLEQHTVVQFQPEYDIPDVSSTGDAVSNSINLSKDTELETIISESSDIDVEVSIVESHTSTEADTVTNTPEETSAEQYSEDINKLISEVLDEDYSISSLDHMGADIYPMMETGNTVSENSSETPISLEKPEKKFSPAESEPEIELGSYLHNLEKQSDKINQIVLEEEGLKIEVNTSREHIILINNSQDYLKHQNCIMDNKCVSFFWPTENLKLVGSRVSISTEKDKTFIIDLDKIDTNLLGVFLNAQRPIKVLFNAKPAITWCLNNKMNLNHIFDVKSAISILMDGKYEDNSTKELVNRYSNGKLEVDRIDFQDFVFIGKFLLLFRKKLVECFDTLGIMNILNLEQRILYILAAAESNGMPYNHAAPNPIAQGIWELVESKYGVATKKELAKAGDILSFNKEYLNERKDLLEVREYLNAETSEKIRQHFDTKYVVNGRIHSYLELGPAASIVAKDYSFDGEGLYSFISPPGGHCLVEGRFKDLEVRVIAKLLNRPGLTRAFHMDEGPYSYFAAPLFEKSIEDLTLDEKFKAKMVLEMTVRSLGDRESLFYAWNTCQAYIKEDEIFSLKERFKKAHPELTNLIEETREKAQKHGYITTSTGRISVTKNQSKAFHLVVEMYMNDIFKRTLELFYHDLELYNNDFSPKIKLCTVYNRIITLECDKSIVNIAIDMLTRNMTRAATKILRGMPVLLKVYGTEQWEV